MCFDNILYPIVNSYEILNTSLPTQYHVISFFLKTKNTDQKRTKITKKEERAHTNTKEKNKKKKHGVYLVLPNDT